MSELSDLLTALPVPERRTGFWDELEARLAAVDAETRSGVAIAPLSVDAVPDEQEPSRPARRRRTRVAVLAAAAAAAAAVIIGLAITDDDPSPSTVVTDIPTTLAPPSTAAPTTAPPTDPGPDLADPVGPGGPLVAQPIAGDEELLESIGPHGYGPESSTWHKDALYLLTDAQVLRTSNGIDWQVAADLADLGEVDWQSIHHTNDSLVLLRTDRAVADDHSHAPCLGEIGPVAHVASSSDGDTWTTATLDLPDGIIEALELGACVDVITGLLASGELTVVTSEFRISMNEDVYSGLTGRAFDQAEYDAARAALDEVTATHFGGSSEPVFVLSSQDGETWNPVEPTGPLANDAGFFGAVTTSEGFYLLNPPVGTIEFSSDLINWQVVEDGVTELPYLRAWGDTTVVNMRDGRLLGSGEQLLPADQLGSEWYWYGGEFGLLGRRGGDPQSNEGLFIGERGWSLWDEPAGLMGGAFIAMGDDFLILSDFIEGGEDDPPDVAAIYALSYE